MTRVELSRDVDDVIKAMDTITEFCNRYSGVYINDIFYNIKSGMSQVTKKRRMYKILKVWNGVE